MWILVANGWMQNPVGSEFNFETMRMEMTSFSELLLNPVTQSKFLHTVTAGYTCGAIFVLSISAYYILKGRDLGFAKRSFSVGASFGLFAIIAVLAMGDESGYEIGKAQPVKLAAMEAEWETHPAPAAFNAIAIPNSQARQNDFAIQIPYLGGLIATRSLDTQIKGLNDIRKENIERVREGAKAVALLEKLTSGNYSEEDKAAFKAVQKDLGFGLLLKQYAPDVANATEEQILKAADATIPKVGPNFWAFRAMVGSGMLMSVIIGLAFLFNFRGTVGKNKLFLKAVLWSMPLPWIAIESGWFLAEYARQPWAVYELLPTGISASHLSVAELWTAIGLLCGLYTIFLVVEMYLMFKFGRLGPSALKTGKYYFEQSAK